MRIMFLNHSFKRHSPQLEAHIQELLRSYASPGTTFELAYPDDLGGGEVLSLLEERKALSGLHHILETPALVQKAIEAERLGFDAVMQSNTFDPGVNTKAVGVSHAELMVRSKISHSQKAYPWSAGLSPEAVSQRSK